MFEAFAIEILLAARSVDSASQVLKIDWSTAQAIMERAVQRGLDRRSTAEIRNLGVDEKSSGKGHDYVTVLTDHDGSRVIEVAAERTIEACDRY
jgi:transposase